MIYFIHGTDRKKVADEAKRLTDGLLLKKPEASFFRLDGDNWSEVYLEELIRSQGLFESKFIVEIKELLSDPNTRDCVLERMESLSGSPNIFILVEPGLSGKVAERIKKVAEKTAEFNRGKEADKKARFNTFSLANFLGKRDRKNLWIGYHRALSEGVTPEEIGGVLHWQVRAILTAIRSAPGQSGLKPFAEKKAKSFGRNWNEEELSDLSYRLVNIYHNARRGVEEFEVGLEKFTLTF